MKSLVVFGSTGNTGICVLQAALKRAFKVRAFVRDPGKLPNNLKSEVDIVQGDVLNETDVRKALEGQDAVVVALGTRNDLSPTTVLSEGMKNIITQMKSLGVEVVSVCISAFLFWDPEKLPPRFIDLNADHLRMYNHLKSSDLKWIAVLPPHIADEPPTDNYIVTHDKSAGRVISKHDLGDFLVKSLTMPEHYKQTCGIAKPAQ
ncbi:hypothetical protein J437_LFUL009736 [Ladona fulva]|uniref:NAD(P)-binding domain-containing protein n=1 Tax=Ladona fulva TaxID=123851 RepID=A0A8K0KBE8_LADFU|nr:hypothetical protein J437_LFUL009736 [Ladona fulva]